MMDYTLKFMFCPRINKDRLSVSGMDRQAKIYNKFLGLIAYLFNYSIRAKYKHPVSGKTKVWYINANSFAKSCQYPFLFDCSTKLKTLLSKVKRPIFTTTKPKPLVESKPLVENNPLVENKPPVAVASSLDSVQASIDTHRAILKELLVKRSPNDVAWQKAQLDCFDQICTRVRADSTLSSISDFEKEVRLRMESKTNAFGYKTAYAWALHQFAQKVFP